MPFWKPPHQAGTKRDTRKDTSRKHV